MVLDEVSAVLSAIYELIIGTLIVQRGEKTEVQS
jgi:hypothetical protein